MLGAWDTRCLWTAAVTALKMLVTEKTPNNPTGAFAGDFAAHVKNYALRIFSGQQVNCFASDGITPADCDFRIPAQ